MMKAAKTIALASALAVAGVRTGTATFAATTAPTTEAHAKCEKDAKDKKLTGAAMEAFVKKCEADAAKPKK
jgi:hypothetical protein